MLKDLPRVISPYNASPEFQIYQKHRDSGLLLSILLTSLSGTKHVSALQSSKLTRSRRAKSVEPEAPNLPPRD